jgi:hypothetical protein
MRAGAIPFVWIGWFGRMDAAFMIDVMGEVQRRGIDAHAEDEVRQAARDVAALHLWADKIKLVPEAFAKGEAIDRLEGRNVKA